MLNEGRRCVDINENIQASKRKHQFPTNEKLCICTNPLDGNRTVFSQVDLCYD